MHKMPPTNNGDVPTSAFLAQTRTLGATSTTHGQRHRGPPKQSSSTRPSRYGKDEYALIAQSTASTSGWTQRDEHDLESRPPALASQPASSSRFQELRKKWPIIEMLADFEREHYRNGWFAPLLVGIVVLLFGGATVLGLLLLFVVRF